jgi:hypothetical protein
VIPRLDVPAGSYLVIATIIATNTSTQADVPVQCDLSVGGRTQVTLEAAQSDFGKRATLTSQSAVELPTATKIDLRCMTDFVNVDTDATVTATKISGVIYDYDD